jgi:hypothetical protein
MTRIPADADGRRFPLRAGFAARKSPRGLAERAGGGFTRGKTRSPRRILRRAVLVSKKLLQGRETSGTDNREGESRAPVQRGDVRPGGGR